MVMSQIMVFNIKIVFFFVLFNLTLHSCLYYVHYKSSALFVVADMCMKSEARGPVARVRAEAPPKKMCNHLQFII